MELKDKNNIKSTFDSILRADYLSLDDFEQLSNLSNYYIDVFNTVSSILQKQDNFISGRRGTGKTTALLKGYFECLKSIKEKRGSEYLSKKVLPIYIDLSNCNDIFDKDNFELFEIHFVRQIIDSLRRQLEAIYDAKSYIVFRKENPAINDLEYIEKILIEGKTVFTSQSSSYIQKDSIKQTDEIKATISSQSVKAQFNSKDGLDAETTRSLSKSK